MSWFWTKPMGDSSPAQTAVPARAADTVMEAPKPAPSPISARSVREDRPKFRREYKATIIRGITMTITARTWWSGRDYSGELTQPGGRWVMFDPDRPAEKILDPVILPEVSERFREIKALDREWFGKNGPDSFVDESGTTWKRAG